ncbi:MAG: response regulator transcription factor [Verrucomicrobia bacterium]|nr:response regulator transcription factor [Verrucomicrobiota bacterium]
MPTSNNPAPPPPPPKTRILLVDDHTLLRRGLAALIETDPDLEICGEAATRQAGLDAIAASQPDLVIADLSLKDSDGLEMIKDIKLRFPLLPVLVLSMHEEAIYAERALRAGARGYVTKQELDDTVLIAIRRLLAGEIHTSETMGRQFIRKFMGGSTLRKGPGMDLLSDRELEVFRLIGSGKTTREIAQTLHLSVKTIESYREHLKAKLELSSGPDLSRCAILWMETGRLK